MRICAKRTFKSTRHRFLRGQISLSPSAHYLIRGSDIDQICRRGRQTLHFSYKIPQPLRITLINLLRLRLLYPLLHQTNDNDSTDNFALTKRHFAALQKPQNSLKLLLKTHSVKSYLGLKVFICLIKLRAHSFHYSDRFADLLKPRSKNCVFLPQLLVTFARTRTDHRGPTRIRIIAHNSYAHLKQTKHISLFFTFLSFN